MNMMLLLIVILILIAEGPVSFAEQHDTGMPQFLPTPHNGRYLVTINQNYVAGSKVIQVECNDSVHNATDFVYGIISSENYFTINNISGIVSLLINAHDLPGSEPYTAIIYCKYSDNDRSSTVQLAVSYRIQNIHVPMFTNGDQILNVSVREDHIEIEGSTIVQLNATDEDLEPCNIVIFTIVAGNNDGNFRIDSQNGKLELNRNLDYDNHPDKYDLTIQATNTQCDRPFSDQITVCVYVVDIDDEQPTFEQHLYTFTFDEGQQPVNFVQLRCSDSDSPGAQIVYEASFSQNEIPFMINHNMGHVSATENLDYERQTSYNLTFTCYNILNSNVRDAATVVVYVNPINEHLPIVTPIFSVVQLNYTAPIGTLLVSARHNPHALFNITATDPDDGLDHGKIKFTLSQNNDHNRYFYLDSDSGDLTLIRQFDFDVCSNERVTTFTLRIVVCDDLQNSSRYVMCPTMVCTILVLIPSSLGLCNLTFVEGNYTVVVSELAKPGSELLQVHCVIPGGGPLQQHEIEVIPPNSDSSQTLRIDHDHVILQQNLDYEVLQNLTVHLNCSDSSGQASIASLFIQVLPENDNPPYFEEPLYFFKVSSNNKIIGSIAAMDDDLQIGNSLSYSLIRNKFFDHEIGYFTTGKLENGSAAINMIKLPSHDTYYVFDIIANDSINTAKSTVLIHVLSTSSLASPLTGTEQCGRICIVLLVILVTFMLTTAAVVVLVCFRFCYASKKKQQQERPVAMGNMMELQDKSDTMGYCTIHQGNSLRRQKDGAFSQMYIGPHVATCPQRQSTEVENPDYHYVATQDLKLDQRSSSRISGSWAPTHQKMIPTDEEEYIKMDLNPDPEPIPELPFSLKSCKDMQHKDGVTFSSLRKEDPFSALDTTPIHSVENIYEHID